MMKAMIRPMGWDDRVDCGHIASQGPLAAAYGFTQKGWEANLTNALAEETNILIVAQWEERVAAFAWAHPRGAFLSAPYMRFIAVDPLYRGKGIARQLMEEFERRTAHLGRPYTLLVSDFNIAAQELYGKLGYQKVGELKDFAISGITEYLMIKQWSGVGA